MSTTRIVTPWNSLTVFIITALAISWVYANIGTPISFENRLAFADAAASERCDISASALHASTPAAAAVCAEWGTEAYLYTLKYPDVAPQLYGLYGKLPEWHAVLERYGHGVIPVVGSFFQEGSPVQQIEHDVGRAVSSILEGRMPTFESETLSPMEHGAYAILQIERDGYDVLARYEVMNGKVATKPITSTLRFAEQLLIGGIKTVEGKLVRNEEVAASEYGLAALDVALLAVGGNAVIKGLRHSGAATVGKVATTKSLTTKTVVGLKSAGIGAGKALMAVGKKAAPAAILLGATYIVVRDPMIAVSGIAWTLEQAGVHPILSMVLASIACAIVLWAIIWAVTAPIRKLYNVTRFALRTV